MALSSESTSFTLDNMGRFLCNTLQEARDSAGQSVAGRARNFDVIIIGGGTFGSVVAEHLFIADTTRSRRILVLEAGPFVLPEHFQNMPFMGGAPRPSGGLRFIFLAHFRAAGCPGSTSRS